MATEFKLQYPIEREGAQTITSLSMRRAKVRDMQKFMKMLDQGDASKAMQEVLSDLCNVQLHVILDMDIEDYAPMMEAFNDFLKPLRTDKED
jgi:hypothetical protein